MGTTQPQLAQNLEDINSSSQKPEKHVNSEHKMKEQEDKIPSETIHIYTKMKQSTNKQDIDKVVYIKRYFDLVNNQTWCFNSEDDHGDDGYGWFVGLVDEAIGLRTLKLICRGHTSVMLRSITELKMPNLLKLCLSHCRLQTIQFLPNLRSPCLRQLYLDNNYISSIKPLRRMSCNISILNIKNNRIYSIEDSLIWMISFNAQEIEGINIEQRCDRSHSLGESIDWIFKLPTQTIIRLDMEAQSRISITMYKYNLIKKKYVGKNGIFLWGPNHSHISRNYNAHFY